MNGIERSIRRSGSIGCRDCPAGFPLNKWGSVGYKLPGELSERSISSAIAPIGPALILLRVVFAFRGKMEGK
jgi:hypothetical protein